MNITEKHFDEIISNKPNLDYDNDLSKLGARDYQIFKCISKYGVKGKNCLDIGPGTGRWIQLIKKQGATRIDGADLSEVVLDRCKHLCNSIIKVDLEKEKISMNDNSYDIILCFMVLEHIKDPTNLLSEIIRTSKNGALVLFTIPNILSFVSRIRTVLGLLPIAIKQDRTHIKFYRKNELENIFKVMNQKISVHPTSFSINPFNTKSFRIRSNKFCASLDDHILFSCIITK